MAVPVLMGFLYRRAPRSAGMAAIVWGIATGFVTKAGLGWAYGPQIYLTQSISIGIFLVSPWLGEMWRSRDGRITVLILGVVFAALILGVMLLGTPQDAAVDLWGWKISAYPVIGAYVAFLLVTLVLFAGWFSRPEDRTRVEDFYEKLDTPVDVAREVTGSRAAALSVFRLVGVLTFVIAIGVLALMGIERAFHPELATQWWKYAVMAGILFVLAALFWLPGRLAKEDVDAG
jgi:hypothetical protein